MDMKQEISKAKGTKTVSDALETFKKEEAAIFDRLPKHPNINPAALKVAIYSEFNKNPKLKDCSVISVLQSISKSVELGLQVGNILGHCYIIPFNNRGGLEASFMLGYKGMIALAARSGVQIETKIVYDVDHFIVVCGTERKIEHIPKMCSEKETKKIIGVYAVARINDKIVHYEVMDLYDINKSRSQSKSREDSSSPWVKFFDEMAKKTVIRKMFNYLPINPSTQEMVTQIHQHEMGITEEDITHFDDVNQ
jgi:recombination protein RecT